MDNSFFPAGPAAQVFSRNVMRPFVRSVGLISTVTLSPVVILMKCFLMILLFLVVSFLQYKDSAFF